MWLTRCVARLPNVDGKSSPPRTAKVARAPARRVPMRMRDPLSAVNGRRGGTQTAIDGRVEVRTRERAHDLSFDDQLGPDQ